MIHGFLRFSISLIAGLILVSSVMPQASSQSGRLETGDQRLPKSGELYDTVPFKTRAGQRIQVDLSSTDFDAYLIIVSPSGDQTSNDDINGSNRNSMVSVIASETGEWKALVTSTGNVQTGAYEIKITMEDVGALTPYTGKLERTDTQSIKGEFYDIYKFQARDGQRVLLDLISNDAKFDTFMIIVAPSGARQFNDDYITANHSYMDTVVEETGEYKLYVTSAKPEEIGDYKLMVVIGNTGQVQRFNGKLESTDQKNENGKQYDPYSINVTAGQHVIVEMTSTEFDTFLIVRSPGGKAMENDDIDSSNKNSRVDFTAEETGEYKIQAAAYEADSFGNYKVKVVTMGAPQAPISTPANPVTPRRR